MNIFLRPHNIFWGDLGFVCFKDTFGLEKHLDVKQKRGVPKFQDYFMISIREEGGRGDVLGYAQYLIFLLIFCRSMETIQRQEHYL